jgi:hypothetical protein
VKLLVDMQYLKTLVNATFDVYSLLNHCWLIIVSMFTIFTIDQLLLLWQNTIAFGNYLEGVGISFGKEKWADFRA